jgi:hypothetical protein
MLSVNQFAIKVGQADRLTKEATKPYRDAYRKATTEERVQLERDWITGYLEGNLGRTPSQAMAIFNQSRTERSKVEQESYKRGYAKFLDHVKSEVRKDEPESNSRTEKVTAPKAIVKSVLDIIYASDMTKAQFDALIAEIKKSVAFE